MFGQAHPDSSNGRDLPGAVGKVGMGFLSTLPELSTPPWTRTKQNEAISMTPFLCVHEDISVSVIPPCRTS